MSSIVLDNSVLSSFHTSQWLESLEKLSDQHTLLASKSIWGEFKDGRKIESSPEWLMVERVDRLPFMENIGELSEQDLTCIALGEIYSGIVVANDQKLKEVAEHRGLQAIWGTKFMLDIFESCRISESELERGKQDYIQDLYLNERTEQAIHQAEKP